MIPEYVILHHSLTKDSQTVSWDAIRNYHTSYRFQGNIITRDRAMELKGEGEFVVSPWKDIGYHWGIELVGDRYELMFGRNMYKSGAHCREEHMNSKSIGVCFIGNFDKDEVPLHQWRVGVKLVKFLQILYAIPKHKVRAHRDFCSYKSCPGEKFDMKKFREEIL